MSLVVIESQGSVHSNQGGAEWGRERGEVGRGSGKGKGGGVKKEDLINLDLGVTGLPITWTRGLRSAKTIKGAI